MSLSETAHQGAQSSGALLAVAGGAGVIGGMGLAAFVVMALTRPRTNQEWAIALICTIMGSFGGGAALILYLDLQAHFRTTDQVQLVLAIFEMIGVAFACGLPGWVLVRIAFNTMRKYEDKTAGDVVHDIKELV